MFFFYFVLTNTAYTNLLYMSITHNQNKTLYNTFWYINFTDLLNVSALTQKQ